MDESTIQSKLEEASEHYNGGRYPEAIRLWDEVLQADPTNEKAKDGIQMASLLVDQFSGASAPQQDGSDGDDTAPVMHEARVQAGISRVRELLAAGQMDEALEGCTLLEELAPDLNEVRDLIREVKAAAGSTPSEAGSETADLDSLLAEARRALGEGRNEEAAEAAMKAVKIDPGNTEACGVIALVEGSGSVGEEQPADAEGMPMPELALEGATQAIPTAAETEPDPDPAVPEPAIPEPETSQSEIPELTLATDTEDGSPPQRIAALVGEGQAAFDGGNFEAAIAAWSRIFAIDQTNAQAGTLIDQAKEALESRARELDEMLYSAADARDAGRTEEAIEICNKILERNPEHAEALALVEEIHSKGSEPEEEITIGIDRTAIEEAAEEKKKQTGDETVFSESVPLAAAPDDVSALPKPRREERPMPPPESARGSGRGRTLAAALVLIVVAAGAGWYFWFGGTLGSTGPRVQMTTPPPMPPSPPPTEAPGASTQQSAPQQNASLQVLPVDPVPAQPDEPEDDVREVDTRSQARSLEKRGRRHFADGDWTAAVLTLREAKQLEPTHFNSESMLDEAMGRLEAEARLERQVRKAIESFNDRDYASALHTFYRLQENDEHGRSYERHIKSSWFNWGVVLLKDGALDEARQKFVEVQDISPGDHEAGRAIEMIDRYENRIVDETFDRYVASLRMRTLE